MDDITEQTRAVELLQQLGLKEYEAKAFVALARRERGTAKDVSETADVPRTRVYDAVRVLESKGLVETQHSNPKVFRAVSVEEAVDTLRAEYDERTERLRETLSALDPVGDDQTRDVTHEVWALSGSRGIATRTNRLVEGASEDVVLVVGDERAFTDGLAERLAAARDRGVEVVVGAVSDDLRGGIRAALPDVEVFVSGLEWLRNENHDGDETRIGRLLLVDGQAILVSTLTPTGDGVAERGVFGYGFDNGLVTIVRRLMETGLRAVPSTEE